MNERVALCIPSGDTWKALTAFHLMSLGAYTAPSTTLMPINVRTQDTAESRNQMTAAALEEGADWLLWIDADMVFRRTGSFGCSHTTRISWGRIIDGARRLIRALANWS